MPLESLLPACPTLTPGGKLKARIGQIFALYLRIGMERLPLLVA